MKNSSFLNKVFVALGICMVMLSMAVFVDEPQAQGKRS